MASPALSVTDALQLFSDYQAAQGLAATTIRNRASIIRGLTAFTDDAVAADTFTLRRFIGRPDITAGSRRTYRGALAAFYAFLHAEGIRDDNPAERLPAPKSPKGEPRPFTADQIDRMLTSGAYARTRAMILVGYYQGFRVSSIARVHGDHIDRRAGTIRTVGKGQKERTLPLHPVIAALSELMPAHDWWFPARGGKTGHIAGHSVTDLITRAKKRAGITDPKLTPHSLRHGFGTDLVERGVDIRVIQELMMHESLSTTQIYTGVSERRKREGLTALPPRDIPNRSGRAA